MTEIDSICMEILIPTFQRKKCVVNNLELLIKIIRTLNLNEEVQISIYDNASPDGTFERIKKLSDEHRDVIIKVRKQVENIGLEANALALLKEASSPYVMFIGDDDFITEGYLKDVLKIIDQDHEVTCIISGFSHVYSDGRIVPNRGAVRDVYVYDRGFDTVRSISEFGHQMSGLVFKREGVFEAYTEKPSYRNIYPFIFFVAYNMLRGKTYYLPIHQTLVSRDNKKDWSYDNSGLLKEVCKNYYALFPNERLKSLQAITSFIMKQSWRLKRGSRNPLYAIYSFIDLILSNEIKWDLKMVLPGVYLMVFMKMVIRRIKRKHKGKG